MKKLIAIGLFILASMSLPGVTYAVLDIPQEQLTQIVSVQEQIVAGTGNRFQLQEQLAELLNPYLTQAQKNEVIQLTEERERVFSDIERNGLNQGRSNTLSRIRSELATIYESGAKEAVEQAVSKGITTSGSGGATEGNDTSGSAGDEIIEFPNFLSTDDDRVESSDDAVVYVQERIGSTIETMFGLLAVLSLIPIVLGGIQMAVSQGGEYAQKGKKTLFWGVIGLVVGFSGFFVISFILDLFIQA